MTGYEVDATLLAEAAKGINDTIAELKTLGISEATEVGRGFSGLELTGMQIGHQAVQQALSAFCERWAWGVRTLVQDVNELAQRLDLSAGMYNDMEQYAVGAFKDLFNSVAGDPHASDERVENESMAQIVQQNKPNYSAESAQKAEQDIAKTWQHEGRDILEGPMGLNKTLADIAGQGQVFDQVEDRVLGQAQDDSQP